MSLVRDDALRTPDEAFANLPGYSFVPRYVDTLPGNEGLRLHYLDEGPSDAPVALCLHGQPTWSYLYRKLIPKLLSSGLRVVAPDLFGFGKSDKPIDENFYTFEAHRETLLTFVAHLDLNRVTLICQDWGGLLGLTLPMEAPERYDRLLVMNTALATGDVPLGPGFEAWRAFNHSQPDLDLAGLMARAAPELTPSEALAYAAPFPDARYKSGVRRFPDLVPGAPDAPGAAISRRARDWWSQQWEGKSFMVVGMQDPVLGPPAMDLLRRQIKGCPEPLRLPSAGHFVQEAGDVIVSAALESFASQA